jgi:hypothetical protein
MPEFVIRPNALEPVPLARLRKAVLSSPYVGESPLAGSFYASRGFAMTFTRAGVKEVLRRFGFLEPFVTQVLSPDAAGTLRPWPLRLLARRPARMPNAFYLNVLLIGPGAGVGLHVDGTLRRDSGEPAATPRLVSVLYLQTPGAAGGELRLYRNWRPVGTIQPAPGTLVHFRGDLKHEVLPFHGGAPDALRASLVCEQYCFGARTLERIPALAVHSKNGFRAYLTERRRG